MYGSIAVPARWATLLALTALLTLGVLGSPAPRAAALTPYQVSIKLDPGTVLRGQSATVSGTVTPAAPGKVVRLQRYYSGDWHTVTSTTLSKDSRYSFAVKRTTVGVWSLRVVKPASATRAAGTSRTVKLNAVTTAFTATATASTALVDPGDTLTFTGTVSPSATGRPVRLQRYAGGTWITVATSTVTTGSKYSLTTRPMLGGQILTYRVMVPYSATVATGTSPTRKTTVTTPLDSGAYHACARSTTARTACWGDNTYGQIGNGTTADAPTPTAVNTLTDDIVSVATGVEHSCALDIAGAVTCWGLNRNGQLGNGTTTDSSTPLPVTGLGSGVAAISGGGWHTCALTTAGAVKCWGYNVAGQIGTGSAGDPVLAPVTVTGLGSGVAAISAGTFHTCAISTAGGLKCWGLNDHGQLGNASWTNATTPVTVSGLGSGVVAVTAGGLHTCALTTAGGVRCWGNGSNGKLGNGNWTWGQTTPVPVTGLQSGVAAVSAEWDHTCALTTAGALRCWGNNNYRQLGDGTTIPGSTPTPVVGLGSGVITVATGSRHTCASTTLSLKCWGDNSSGALGDGTGISTGIPVTVGSLD